ncbi:medium chain dehydrogenase/reductase family protein [Halomonas almeriensis]|uniref:medium chain dehydrogenase/reductase family protein n=1 Tax=Halomonas almeriensis TaxID=308163 RepID=UPI0025B4D47F|nr:medium chain dehydrogenase/reductase family protein [Halomonas almeriensis]MDN3554182.1 medium chain dehydrogenase/reductase family protein [Halomonas almeriensis]
MSHYQRVVITGHGGVDVLDTVQEAIPQPGGGEVCVRVLAAGVGYADVMAQHGGYPLAPGVPFTPGYDLVGIVEQVGGDVVGIETGQYVAALNPEFGCYAEYACVPHELLVPVPDELDPVEAVSLILNYLTAHALLHEKGQLHHGETVLIHAAAGGVGTALLQLGGLLDLTMYGTASARKHVTVRENGGIPIDYQNQDFVEAVRRDIPGGVDAAFDPFGGPNLRRSYKAVRKSGRVISYGFAGERFGGMKQMVLGMLQMAALNSWPDGKRVTLCATPGEVKKDSSWYRETLAELFAMLASGKVKPVIGARVPLADVQRAHRMVEKGEVSGKVVLVCGS